MAYKPKVLTVAEGGTGLATLTNHSIQIGAAASNITQLGVGSTGTVLTGVTGADPAFSAAPTLTSVNFGGSTLNTYAESTAWTPTLAFGGASVGITYGSRLGIYTRIGNVVCIAMEVVLTSKGSSVGSMTITGLPFGSENSHTYPQSVRYSVLTYVGQIGCRITGSTAYWEVTATTGSATSLADTAFANNSTIQFSGIYLV